MLLLLSPIPFLSLVAPCPCREGHDRDVLTLPGMQLQLMQQVKKATPDSTPLIVVLMSGGPVDISWAKVSSYGCMEDTVIS